MNTRENKRSKEEIHLVFVDGEGIAAKNSVEDFRFGARARASFPAGNPPAGSHVSGQGRENSPGAAARAPAG
jgi:hypothetical protein